MVKATSKTKTSGQREVPCTAVPCPGGCLSDSARSDMRSTVPPAPWPVGYRTDCRTTAAKVSFSANCTVWIFAGRPVRGLLLRVGRIGRIAGVPASVPDDRSRRSDEVKRLPSRDRAWRNGLYEPDGQCEKMQARTDGTGCGTRRVRAARRSDHGRRRTRHTLQDACRGLETTR